MQTNKQPFSDSIKLHSAVALIMGTALMTSQALASENIDSALSTAQTACGAGLVTGEFETRCNAIFGQGGPGPEGKDFIFSQATSEQTASQKSMSLEMNDSHLNTVNSRIGAVRSGRQSGGMRISGLTFDASGNPMSTTQLARFNDNINKAAAGDDLFDRLGIFFNGNIGFGDRVTTINEIGYQLDTHGGTAGIDYRFSDNFLLGTAFSYHNSRSGFDLNRGDMEADNYSGAIYGSFFTEDGLFIDGIFSGGHIDYQSRRHIEYTVPEVINTDAFGQNSGTEFNIAMTGGYNFNFGGLLVTPQVRVDYANNQVDALDETGGDGWALHIDDQHFDSLQTAAGLQLAYVFSSSWAVIIPTVQAEYIHEFNNDARTITAYYQGNTTQDRFAIRTDRPDRDYIIMNAGVSAQFAHGISAFVNYDTVQAHSYVSNHNFSGGIRMELSF